MSVMLHEAIKELCAGEAPEALLIGEMLFDSFDAALPALQVEMYPENSWSYHMPPVRVWTASYVIFSDDYDARPYLARVERHPCSGPVREPTRDSI